MQPFRFLFIISIAVSILSCNHHTGKTVMPEDKITVASFTRSEDYRLVDTVNAIELPAYLADERSLPADSAATLQQLLDAIQKNGTEDISKCFIPRHTINYYKDGKIGKFILVCFECEGVRFSDAPASSPVKNAEKRIEQMTVLKKYFALN